MSIALQWSLAHAIHARSLRLEQSMALLPPPPPPVPLSSSELHIVVSFVLYDRLKYLSFLGCVNCVLLKNVGKPISLQERDCKETTYP